MRNGCDDVTIAPVSQRAKAPILRVRGVEICSTSAISALIRPSSVACPVAMTTPVA